MNTAQIKKYASVAFVFVLVSVLAALGHVAVPLLPAALQAPALGLVASAFHWINTWGHGERVMAAVNNSFMAWAAAGELTASPSAESPESRAAIAAIKSAFPEHLPPDNAA